jgi:hypothetical protein
MKLDSLLMIHWKEHGLLPLLVVLNWKRRPRKRPSQCLSSKAVSWRLLAGHERKVCVGVKANRFRSLIRLMHLLGVHLFGKLLRWASSSGGFSTRLSVRLLSLVTSKWKLIIRLP